MGDRDVSKCVLSRFGPFLILSFAVIACLIVLLTCLGPRSLFIVCHALLKVIACN